MRRLLVLAFLLATIGFGASFSGGPSAYAAGGPLCSAIHGTSCSPNGSTTPCTTDDNFNSSCTCRNLKWRCLL